MIERVQRFKLPRTLDEAAKVLISDLTPQQTALIAKMDDAQFDYLCEEVLPYLQDDFYLWRGNDQLLISCFKNVDYETSTDPMRIIMNYMRSILQSHTDIMIIA
ncbi:MAG: hypothetical protein PVI90_04725 [Desulfobacteraceae bacterium]|jgi:hypothetical protein